MSTSLLRAAPSATSSLEIASQPVAVLRVDGEHDSGHRALAKVLGHLVDGRGAFVVVVGVLRRRGHQRVVQRHVAVAVDLDVHVHVDGDEGAGVDGGLVAAHGTEASPCAAALRLLGQWWPLVQYSSMCSSGRPLVSGTNRATNPMPRTARMA